MKKINLIREEYVSPEMEVHSFVFHSCILDGSGNTENPGGNDNPGTGGNTGGHSSNEPIGD